MRLSRAAALEIVAKKSRGAENSALEIDQFIQAYNADELDEALVVDWLGAIMRAGMSLEETAALTKAMADSGETIDWSGIPGVVDKHSTGGVGDDVSLIAVPLAAACGARVAKLSGGALGHTGGTLDKLACIPGFRSDLSLERFKNQVAGETRCAIAAATEQLAPADKKLYHLRHRTDTIASVPLITASVLSKKIAGGAPSLVIDVKAGRCAFMRSFDEAQALAEGLVAVATRLGKKIEVLMTDMDAPLADAIGDEVELQAALDVLRTNRPTRLREVSLVIAAALISLATGVSLSEAQNAARNALASGAAWERFRTLVAAQGGDLSTPEPSQGPTRPVPAADRGYVQAIDGRALGLLVARHKRENHGRAGLKLLKRRGDLVEVNEPLACARGMTLHDDELADIRAAFVVGAQRITEPRSVLRSVIAPAPNPEPSSGG